MLKVDDLITANAIAAGVDPRRALSARMPVYFSRGPVAHYACKLGDFSLSQLAAAIANAEGFNVANSIAKRANNPGNLHRGNQGSGTLTESNGTQVTIYPTLADGEKALEDQIQRIISGTSTAGYKAGMSIAQVADIWVSGVANSGRGVAWAQNVANFLGVSPSDPFAAQAGAGGGSLIQMEAAAVNEAIENATGVDLPAWVPYAVMGLAGYLVLDAVL